MYRLMCREWDAFLQPSDQAQRLPSRTRHLNSPRKEMEKQTMTINKFLHGVLEFGV